MSQFATDSREYNCANVIEEALHLYAAAQDTDRIGIRCIRPLCNRDDGTPILDRRGEQVR